MLKPIAPINTVKRYANKFASHLINWISNKLKKNADENALLKDEPSIESIKNNYLENLEKFSLLRAEVFSCARKMKIWLTIVKQRRKNRFKT